MDTTGPPAPTDDLLPPVEPSSVYFVGYMGVAACGVAAVLGLLTLAIGNIALLDTLRLILVATGLLIAGAAISMRPSLPLAWLIGAVAAGLAIGGLPEHWDSARLLAKVLTVLGILAASLAALPAVARYSVISLFAVFHFGGILTATTWPDPTPWLTNQVGYRVYMPYLSFLYLRNAYHFYSPEPGPASHLFVLLKYELDETDPNTGKPKVVHEWITLPRRDEHMKDPLGQSYYRRLSITEMVSPSIPGLVSAESFEKLDARERRFHVSPGSPAPRTDVPIPLTDAVDPAALQYRIPQPHISRYLFPSYAKHLASEYSSPGRKVVGVKIYRVEHRIAPPSVFKDKASPFSDPYHPSWYRPYFCGDYDANGKLIDPKDPMLYWLVPIVPGGEPGDPEKKNFTDYLSKHARFKFDWEGVRP